MNHYRFHRLQLGVSLTGVLSMLLLATCVTAATEPAKPVHDFAVGQIRVRTLKDAGFQMPLAILKGIEPKAAEALAGGDKAETPANAFLVRLPGQIVLVDSGAGPGAGEDSGHLLPRLQETGVTPDQVNLILITHFHFDHIGGLGTADGKAAFPNAIVRASRAEHEFWMRDPESIPAELRDRAKQLQVILAPYVQAKRYEPFGPGDDLGAGIKALAATGHTPGHTGYVFSSQGQELWCIGDLIHIGRVQFAQPEAWVSFDSDGQQAIATRLDFFRRAAAGHVLLAGAHLPALVRLEQKGAGFVAIPEPQQ